MRATETMSSRLLEAAGNLCAMWAEAWMMVQKSLKASCMQAMDHFSSLERPMLEELGKEVPSPMAYP